MNHASGIDSTRGTGPAIHWDESCARTISPTACTISATREEFSLLFATDKSLCPDGQQGARRFTERIILSPFIVKRLAASLNEVVRQYELRFGPLVHTPPVTNMEHPISPPGRLFPGMPWSLPEKGQALFDLVTALNVRTALEDSFKVHEGCLLESRFLLGISRIGTEDPLDEGVKRICENLDMPADFVSVFTHLLPDANHIYFGFEEDGNGSLYKVYLEFRDRAEEKIRAGVSPLTSLLLHMGLKWDASDHRRRITTRYEWYPSIHVRDILARLPTMLVRRPGHDPLAVAEAVIGLVSERIEPRDVQYVEVTEEGNPRKSFDINMYKAGVRIMELMPFLMRMAEYYGLDMQDFRLFCERIRSKKFGHLAGGVDREGRDFMTVYYGVEYIQAHGVDEGIKVSEAPNGIDLSVAP